MPASAVHAGTSHHSLAGDGGVQRLHGAQLSQLVQKRNQLRRGSGDHLPCKCSWRKATAGRMRCPSQASCPPARLEFRPRPCLPANSQHLGGAPTLNVVGRGALRPATPNAHHVRRVPPVGTKAHLAGFRHAATRRCHAMHAGQPTVLCWTTRMLVQSALNTRADQHMHAGATSPLGQLIRQLPQALVVLILHWRHACSTAQGWSSSSARHSPSTSSHAHVGGEWEPVIAGAPPPDTTRHHPSSPHPLHTTFIISQPLPCTPHDPSAPTWLVEPGVPVDLGDGRIVLEVVAEESAEVVAGERRGGKALDVSLEEGLKGGGAAHQLLRGARGGRRAGLGAGSLAGRQGLKGGAHWQAGAPMRGAGLRAAMGLCWQPGWRSMQARAAMRSQG